jgi:hypothetical protein
MPKVPPRGALDRLRSHNTKLRNARVDQVRSARAGRVVSNATSAEIQRQAL